MTAAAIVIVASMIARVEITPASSSTVATEIALTVQDVILVVLNVHQLSLQVDLARVMSTFVYLQHPEICL